MKQIYIILIVLSVCFLNLYSQDISNKSVGEILDKTGVIKPKSSGSYNAEGYEMTYGNNKEPIFKKIDHSASVQTATYSWGSVGSGRNGTDGLIYAIAADGSGNVYVGGTFTLVGDIPASYIAKWNGTSWSTLPSGAVNGVNSSVSAIAISGSDVYVGGYFSLLGDGTTSANGIAKWNTTTSTWSTLTSGAVNGVNSSVSAIAISGSDVYVGGQFTLLGDGTTSANYIAKWNTTTSTWSTLPSGASNGVLYGGVNAIAISGSDVYVGGDFALLGDGATLAYHMARWSSNTNSWSALASHTTNGVPGGVNAIAISGSDVYIGGGFTLLVDGVTSANNIAIWNSVNNTWSTLTSGASNGLIGGVSAIAISGSDVYVGGGFEKLGDGTTSAKRIAKWNSVNNSWSTLPSGASNGVNFYYGGVNAIAISGSDVYVGGGFTLLGDGTTSANSIAKWNGGWSTLGSGNNGVNSGVNAIAISGGDVYVGGSFTLLGDGTSANNIAKWNTTTSTWSTLPSGASNGVGDINSGVYAIAISGSDVFVGGNFTLLGDGTTSANNIAKWNTTSSTWSTLTSGASNGVNHIVYAIAISGSDVYMGGAFTLLGDGTTLANYIAKWNTTTSTWSTLTSGASNGLWTYPYGGVLAIAISGSDVYVGGGFTLLGDGTTSAKGIAKWNSVTNSWSTLPSGASNGVIGGLYVIVPSGSDVYVGGNFALLGDGTTSANYIAKWNTTTSTWSTLTSGSSNGVSGTVNTIAISGSDVYVGGAFTALGDGTPSANYLLAKWNGSNLSALGVGANSGVSAMQVSPTEGKMYLGGGFTILNGTTGAYFVGTFTDSDNPLPVELISFTAHSNGSAVTLNWQTATEVNNYGFEVQKSEISNQNSIWEKVGFVNGSGNSNSIKEYSFTETNIGSGKYYYRLKKIDKDGGFIYSNAVEVNITALPTEYTLYQNYPNPFNPSTKISYQLPKSSFVTLKVYDIIGREISTLVNEQQNAGQYEVAFDGSKLASGEYLYRIQAGDFISIKKLVLLK